MAAPTRPPRRMSDAEALMWNVEKDPGLRSDFLNITFLEHPPDLDRLRRRMQHALPTIPRLRQRVVSAPARLGPPEWAEDPHFDLDHHVRRLSVAAPGSERQLLDLAASLYEDAFDRARPLWQFTVVEGLEAGRAALLSKMHHTITDGVGGLRLSMQFLDLEPDPDDTGDRASGLETVAMAPDSIPRSGGGTSPIAAAARAATHNIGRSVDAARRAAEGAVGLATHPQRLPGAAVDAFETTRSLVRQAAVLEPARSPLWTRRSLRRRFEALSLDLDELKRTAKTLGGTVNDVYVTGVAAAAGAYHRAKGADVDELRMAMPVNTRSDRSSGGNAFAPTRVLVPAADMAPRQRFEEVRERLSTTKHERALGLTDSLAAVLNGLPTALLVRLARQQAQTVDFATSNLRGAPFDLYVAGARVVSNHPMGPTAGTAFNATVLSYREQLDCGLNCDPAAIDDPELLKRCLLDAFAELAAAR